MCPSGAHEFLRRRQRHPHRPGIELLGETLKYPDQFEIQGVNRPLGKAHDKSYPATNPEPHRLRHTLANDDSRCVSGLQRSPFYVMQIGTDLRFQLGFDALANDSEIALAVVEHSRESQTRENVLYSGLTLESVLDPLRFINQISLWSASFALSKPLTRELQVTGLGMDDCLAQLCENVLNEPPGQDQPRHADSNCDQRGRRTRTVAEDIAQGKREAQAHWLYLKASTTFRRPAFHAGIKLARKV